MHESFIINASRILCCMKYYLILKRTTRMVSSRSDLIKQLLNYNETDNRKKKTFDWLNSSNIDGLIFNLKIARFVPIFNSRWHFRLRVLVSRSRVIRLFLSLSLSAPPPLLNNDSKPLIAKLVLHEIAPPH